MQSNKSYWLLVWRGTVTLLRGIVIKLFEPTRHRHEDDSGSARRAQACIHTDMNKVTIIISMVEIGRRLKFGTVRNEVGLHRC